MVNYEKPRYLVIAEALIERIASGEWAVGERLPGTAALMEQYDVPSFNTIASALSVLRRQGLIRTRQGSGTWLISLTPSMTVADALLEVEKAIAALEVARAVLRDLDS